MSFASNGSQTSLSANETQILDQIGSLLSSMNATSTSGMGAMAVDVLQMARDILGTLGNQSGGSASTAAAPDPAAGSMNLGEPNPTHDQGNSLANPNHTHGS